MAVFIFRRDLRVHDNTALINALKDHNGDVICLFVFNKMQTSYQNQYFSENAFQFMLESLIELDEQLNGKLTVLSLDDFQLVELLKKINREIYYNKDYTHFARKRDDIIKDSGLIVKEFSDYTILDLENIKNQSGTYYKIFTPFYDKYIELLSYKNIQSQSTYDISKIIKLNNGVNIRDLYSKLIKNNLIADEGGRKSGLKRISNLIFLNNYAIDRDYPIKPTSMLSPHIKFGTISIRECYMKMKELYGINCELIRQLIWHDFYANIMLNEPYYNTLGGGNIKNIENIQWVNNRDHFDLWKKGMTGVPIVDAGMRQLKTTGWMHNRVRMVVSTYLVHYLGIDWKWGEKYFSTQLIDYDPSSNNGNWQWNAGVGSNRGHKRIMNPFIQAEKYDKKAEYIKKWVPELRGIDYNHIIKWDSEHIMYNGIYQHPISTKPLDIIE